ncbi:MAG: sulfatase-like hydrolase/transferase [Kiritimatiellales bacterium]|nr:sulfatase-like hydrolase/transferase [Kiritimatiellales bacterium]
MKRCMHPALTGASARRAQELPARPNIILIMPDQWRGDCLGLYQNAHPVITPHLNQLAAEGVMFTQAYADCPICMPQRVTLLTGKTGSQMRCLANFPQVECKPVFDENITLPARLRDEAGYQTKGIGKMHFCPERAMYGFDEISLHPNDYLKWLAAQGFDGGYRGHGLGGNDVVPATASVPDWAYHTTWAVQESVAFIEQRDSSKPFFLYLAFEAPHPPFDPPEPYDRMYDNIPVSDPLQGDWVGGKNDPPQFRINRLSNKWDYLNPATIRESRRRYYGMMTQIDYHLGHLFGALRQRGLHRNTVVVFTSDHGESLGDHGLFAKLNFLQSAARVPLLMSIPGLHPFKAERFSAPVLTADICPTLLELAGLEPDPKAEGQSLLTLMDDPEAFDNRVIVGEVRYGCAMALDAEWKYIYYAEGGCEQLFNIQTDSNDMLNRIDDPDQEPVVERLKAQLITHLEKNNSDIVENGKLVVRDKPVDESACRITSPAALRGPMRTGDGY